MAAGKAPAVTQKLGKTGKAEIVRQGQTASGNFGDDPNMRSRGVKEPRDLRP